MKLLVTGGAGRLGQELCKGLSQDGYQVTILDLPQALERTQIPKGCTPFPGSVTDPQALAKAIRNVEAVIHLAALLPPSSEADEGRTIEINVGGTRKVIDAVRDRDIPLIFASSVTVYGVTADETPPIGEDHPLKPHNIYSRSKIQAEEMIRDSGIPHTILRIAPISLPILTELPGTLPYQAQQRVEFIHIKDAATALHHATEEEPKNQAYNIAGGPTWQHMGEDYIQKFYDSLGVEVELNFSKEPTALDWYDTTKSQILNYQDHTFKVLLQELHVEATKLGLVGG
jgi:nucleoside-diphosphate-sugar epimerase